MSYKRYSEYKDSGIEWIGEIPKGWSIRKIKYICSIYTGNSISDTEKDNYTDEENAVPYIATKDINILNNEINYENGMYIPYDDNDFKVAPKNSILLCIEGGSAGKKIAYTEKEVCYVNKLCNFITNDSFNSKYLYYILQSDAFLIDFNLNISGLIGGVSKSIIKNIFTIYHNFNDQQSIASYLDTQCALIDKAIETQNKIIEKLKEYKKSIITEAVTKGLDKNSKMKDSGIEWIGEIPEGWKVRKFKYICDISSGDALTKEDIDDKYMYEVYGGGELIGFANKFNIDNCILVGRVGANCGCVKKIDKKCWATDNALVLQTNYNKSYITYLLIASDLNKLNESNAQPLITATKINNFKISFTVSDLEQEMITNYLNKKCEQIDTTISNKEQIIDKLQNYKKSLIYECVTGKRRIE